MNLLRRALLKRLAATGALAALAFHSLLRPLSAFGADDRTNAFENNNLAETLEQIGAAHSTESSDITIEAPALAEDGAVVPIDAKSRIPGTTRLMFLVDKNPFPLAADFVFSAGALPEMGIRLRFNETSLVRVVAIANGQVFHAITEVKVTVGGCGG
jgi:sulfur-oxidizing protein SoxY